MKCFGHWLPVVAVLIGWSAAPAWAEPYLAVRQDLKCNGCHINATGGGMRSDFGVVFAQTALPAHPAMGGWMGKIGELLRLGGDLRSSWSNTFVPHQDTTREFALDQVRVYADLTLLSGKVGLYLDQQLAPGTGQTQEAYVRLGNPAGGWYMKGGKFYLPFGWRLQDNSAFVRQATGVNMTAPDTGVEFGYENASWSTQLTLTQGPGNVDQGSGSQMSGQVVWMHPRWRLGAAAAFTDSDFGDRRMGGLFAGLHTGPVVWLAEADLISDAGFPLATRSLAAGLAEIDWAVHAGHNLKLTAEYYDSDRDVDENEQNRWSLVYEVTPLPFVQVRLGHRRYVGIPQNDLQNRSLTFVELHGFF